MCNAERKFMFNSIMTQGRNEGRQVDTVTLLLSEANRPD